MILERSHRNWLLISLLVLAAGGTTYAMYAGGDGEPSGGSLPGMLYGLVGTAMMVFAGLLSARRQVPTWRIGSAQFWLKGHIWLGLLSVPFLLFHAGFHWGGPVEIGLWLTTSLIVFSGIVGLAFQQVLPRLLTTRVTNETFVDQIPFQCSSMQFLADKAIAETCGKLDVSTEVATQVAEQVARQRKWLKRESDLQKLVDAIYETPPRFGTDEPARRKSERPAGSIRPEASTDTAAPSGGGDRPPLSVLEQAQQQAGSEDQQVETPRPMNPKSLSVLEQAQQQAGSEAQQVETPRPVNPKSMSKEQRPSPPPRRETTADPQRAVIRTEELKSFYLASVRPFLSASADRRAPLGQRDRRRVAFQQMRVAVPTELHATLDQLDQFCERRDQINQLKTIHAWLHGWLYLHVPLSAALLILFVCHVVISLRVVPWQW